MQQHAVTAKTEGVLDRKLLDEPGKPVAEAGIGLKLLKVEQSILELTCI